MADWHVGQEIICVDTNWVNDKILPHAPVKGRIYTIEWIGCDDNDTHGPYFSLFEITASTKFWYAWHFRPVKKTKTDISCFTSLLTPTKVLEDA